MNRSWVFSFVAFLAVACSKDGGKPADKAPPPAAPPDAAAAQQPPTPTPVPAPVSGYLTLESGAIREHAGSAPARTLAEGAVKAAYDPVHELVWLSTKSTLSVIDLRDPAAKPVPIATGLPGAAFLVRRGQHAVDTGWDDGIVPGMPYRTALDWGDGKPKLSWDVAAPSKPAPDVLAAADHAVSRARLLGTAWLKAQVTRTARPAPPEPGEAPEVALPADIGPCDSERIQCGEAEPFGTTGWSLVYVRAEYEGEGFTSSYECALYDPAGKRWAVPPDTVKWGPLATSGKLGSCGPYRFARDGKTFLFADRVCSTGVACTPMHGDMLGWRDPGMTVGRADET